MNLFNPVAPPEKWHPIFQLIMQPRYAPERAVLSEWAKGFVDRDNKFVYEFQTTFEPCLWELYLFAFFKEQGFDIDFGKQAPDFIITKPTQLCVEAVIAAPAQGEQPAFGAGPPVLPDNLNEFNAQATLRICNSFSVKEKKYQKNYNNLNHVKNKPFVIAIGSFDRPNSHLAANRPIMAALFGNYYDEEASIAVQSNKVKNYKVEAVNKKAGVDIPLGLFVDDTYKHVSAVIFSTLATWGKIRALAINPDEPIVFTTIHPNEESIMPIVNTTIKRDYVEHLADGLYIFHNPFAETPLDRTVFHNDRLAQLIPHPDGTLEVDAPEDFLIIRSLNSVKRI